VYDPAKDRGHRRSETVLVLAVRQGEPALRQVWKLDVYTALSRRIGIIDPYVKAHFTKMYKSNGTYSNCDRVNELNAAGQVNSQAVTNCKTWGEEAGAKLPWLGGIILGTEVVPYEDPVEGQKVSIDFRLFADYTSPQRFYNELTDATGKIHQTGSYVTMGGLFGLYLQASDYISLQATASLATRSAHYVTGESLGKNGSDTIPGDITGLTPNPELNPNRLALRRAGRRFRISVSIFARLHGRAAA
jgi:hypothetical protein